MLCSACQKEYPSGTAFCPRCGMALVPFARVTLAVSGKELRSCAKKTVSFPGMERPVSFSLTEKLHEGQTLRVKNARFSTPSGPVTGELHILLTAAGKGVKTARKKKKTPFGVHLAAVTAVFPLTFLFTALLYYFGARPVLEAAGMPAMLFLSGIALLLLLFLGLTVPKRYKKARIKSRVVLAALALSLALRYGPPRLGVDMTRLFSRIGGALFPAFRTEQTLPAPKTPSPLPAQEEIPVPEETPAAKAVFPDFSLRPYLALLTEEERKNFDALYEAAVTFKKQCLLPCRAAEEDVARLMLLLRLECPELLMIDFSAPFYTVSGYTGVKTVELPFALDRTAYEAEKAVCLEAAGYVKEASADMSAEEKIRFAYEFTAGRTAYSLTAPHAATAYGVFHDGLAKCDGISLSLKWLLETLGFRSAVVTGSARTSGEGHAWNVVETDGGYFAIDATADLNKPGEFLYPALLTPESAMEEVYAPDEALLERFRLPFSTAQGAGYHIGNRSFAETYQDAVALFSRGFRSLGPDGGSFLIQCANEEDFAAFTEALDGAVKSLFAEAGKGGGYTAFTLAEFRTVRIVITFS